MISAIECHRCHTSLINLPSTAQVSVPVEETFQAQAFAAQNNPFGSQMPDGISPDNELGRKTVFWYRVYLGVMVALYIAGIGLGVFLIYFSQFEPNAEKEMETFIAGIAYSVIAVPFAIAFAIALFLPRKPWNWVVGIVYIALGMTSCCFLPATVPLLIYWLKPETKAYFGRN
jgi:MFS family permease